MEPQADKKSTCLPLDIVQSKLQNVKGREWLKEKREIDQENQAKKGEINITNETNVDKSREDHMSNVVMKQKDKCLQEQNKAGDSCEKTTDQKHKRITEENEQTEQILLKNGLGESHIRKTNYPIDVETEHLQEQYDTIMEKVLLTENPSKSNPTELLNKVDTKEHNEEVIQKKKQQMIHETMCLDAKTLHDDMDNMPQCEAKENQILKSDCTEKRENGNTMLNKPEDEHIYEEPDIIHSSAELSLETECLKESLKHLDNITLHIAVTGSTGAGKSSFINAIRGLQPDDVNAAPTGPTETTITARKYTHPSMPNVNFWDLPGTGSPMFKAKKYLKEMKLETFDFFLIISSERFKENDIMLAKAIKESKKLFYFLRTKIDNDIQAESQKKTFDEQKVLSHIREECHRNLRDMIDPNVFLISSFELHKYDFQTLIDTLENRLPVHKRDALMMSLPIYSSRILEKKIECFMKQTRSAAIASGSIAVAPVPGLSMACDAAILLAFFTKCYYAFGLDDESIDKLSVRVNNASLKLIRRSPLVVAVGQKKLSNKELSALASKKSAVKFAWSMVPVVGSKKTAKMSYSGTLNLLQAGLQDLADTAREVLKAAGLTNVY